jgi:hypothetical protein
MIVEKIKGRIIFLPAFFILIYSHRSIICTKDDGNVRATFRLVIILP